MCINQSAFEKLKRPFYFVFYVFRFKTCPNLKVFFYCLCHHQHVHHNIETKSRWCVKRERERETKRILGGSAPGPVLVWFQSADQPLDALQLVCSVFLRAGFGGHGDRTRGDGGRVAGHLRRGIQRDSRHGAGRDQAVAFQLRPAAGHAGRHGGGEQRAVRRRHGERVGTVPEPGTHCV